MTEEEANEASFVGDLIFELMLQYHNNDQEKVKQWFSTHNPWLGFATPATLIQSGKHCDVLDHVYKLIPPARSRQNGQ